MSTQFNEPRSAIAPVIGPYIGYFEESDRKRFTGLELLGIVAGAFLVGFLKGFGEEAGKNLGVELADYMTRKIHEARGKDKADQDMMLAQAHDEIAAIIQKQNLDSKKLDKIADHVEAELVKVLSRDAPDDVSTRIAATVKNIALKLLSAATAG